MPLATYVGDQEHRDLWGVRFARGVAVGVDDKLAHKCKCLGFFVESEPAKPAPMIVEDTDTKQVEALGIVLAQPEPPAVAETPAPRKRGRPRKAAADGNV
jgi:hypothetical protein